MTPLILLARAALAAPCLLPQMGGPGPLHVVPLAALGDEKLERDAYGTFPNSLTGQNFIVKWGDSGGVTEDEAATLLDDFETAWATEIDAMGHPAPAGSETALFNIYIGDTGRPAPSGYGAGGYYDSDPDGWPMVVVARDSLYDSVFAQVVAGHEFYHAVQDAAGTFPYGDSSAWYWEATADWASKQVFPDNPDYAVFLFGYAFLPYLPMSFFDYPDSGALQEYHQYGAFIFPQYLSEIAEDWTIIRDSWVDGRDSDPLVVLDGLLEERGSSLPAIFADFTAHNATWDYEDRDIYLGFLEYYDIFYDDLQVIATVEANGTDGLVAAPSGTLPQRYGYNVIAAEALPQGPYTVGFAGEPEGDAGSPASFGAVVVIQGADSVRYAPLTLSDNAGELTVELLPTDQALYLAVSAWSDANKYGESFAYSYRVDPEATDSGDSGDSGVADDTGLPSDTGEGKAVTCACASAGGDGTGAWLGGLVALALLRRRPTRS